MMGLNWLGVMALLLAGVGTAFALDINVLILKDLKQEGKYLKLNHSGMLYDAGIKQLAESKLLEKVETLDLNTHNIGDEGAEATESGRVDEHGLVPAAVAHDLGHRALHLALHAGEHQLIGHLCAGGDFQV